LPVDGHTDRFPITKLPFAWNWELSTARAVSVVSLLASQDIGGRHMRAAGFGELHPIATGDTPEGLPQEPAHGVEIDGQVRSGTHIGSLNPAA
jgi:chemotaxis protein MotB